MSYIEKEKLIKADIASIENKVRHAFNQGYDLGFKDGKGKAKPLEQEPKSEWQHDHEILKAYSDGANEILDNIRAEIEEKADGSVGEIADGLYDALEIIDKHISGKESEDKE